MRQLKTWSGTEIKNRLEAQIYIAVGLLEDALDHEGYYIDVSGQYRDPVTRIGTWDRSK